MVGAGRDRPGDRATTAGIRFHDQPAGRRRSADARPGAGRAPRQRHRRHRRHRRQSQSHLVRPCETGRARVSVPGWRTGVKARLTGTSVAGDHGQRGPGTACAGAPSSYDRLRLERQVLVGSGDRDVDTEPETGPGLTDVCLPAATVPFRRRPLADVAYWRRPRVRPSESASRDTAYVAVRVEVVAGVVCVEIVLQSLYAVLRISSFASMSSGQPW